MGGMSGKEQKCPECAAVGVAPFILGAWEFGTRIRIQRKCVKCSGSGLVGMSGEGGQAEE